jgi:hypothetical protein
MGMVSGCKGVIIEGTSVLDYIKPDVAIMIKAKGKKIKPSAKRALKKADLIISSAESEKAVEFVKEKIR